MANRPCGSSSKFPIFSLYFLIFLIMFFYMSCLIKLNLILNKNNKIDFQSSGSVRTDPRIHSSTAQVSYPRSVVMWQQSTHQLQQTNQWIVFHGSTVVRWNLFTNRQVFVVRIVSNKSNQYYGSIILSIYRYIYIYNLCGHQVHTLIYFIICVDTKSTYSYIVV